MIVVIILIIIGIAFLGVGVTGNIAGVVITLPIIGWIILGLVALLVVILALKIVLSRSK